RDCGSDFVIRLPLTTNRPRRDIVTVVDHDPQQLRLAIVEDADDAREMLAALLTLDGYRVETAADGQTGLDLILQSKPDVAMVDIGLPILDGYQIARHLREHFKKEEVFLIALTGHGREEDHEAVLEAGFDEHLVKPVHIQELKAVFGKAVAARCASGNGSREGHPRSS
ncbi:MAG: response regulator, partial [Pirellulaceae bacterium]